MLHATILGSASYIKGLLQVNLTTLVLKAEQLVP